MTSSPLRLLQFLTQGQSRPSPIVAPPAPSRARATQSRTSTPGACYSAARYSGARDPGTAEAQHPLNGLRSHLSQRIALSVFSSIVAIEALILIPSVYRHEQDLLTHLAQQSSASLTTAITPLTTTAQASAQSVTPQQLLQQLTVVQSLPFVAGGSLYRHTGTSAGEYLGSVGQPPDLTYDQLQAVSGPRLNRRQQRYDSAWVSPLLDDPLLDDYVIIISHNTEAIRGQVLAYIGRILGLVLLIAGSVTLSTFVLLRSFLVRPILALRSAESKLRDSESRLRSLVQQAAESILVIDRDGLITDVNTFALQHLHYHRSTLLDKSIFDIAPHLTPETFRTQWQTLSSGQPITFETLYCCKFGQSYPVEVRGSLIEQAGEKYMLSLARDISDRKNAEAVQARLAEIGQLAAMIVHEVRNPLATIYMALTGFGKLDLPRAGQLRLELALEEAERLKRLLNEILTYSREQRLAGEGVEINGLCQELYQSLQQLPAARGREIRLKPFSQRLMVSGDRDKLKQVFINLVTNACEAVAAGETVHWSIQRAPQRIKVQVQNGGEPIPANILPKLAQPFVSTKDGGNGLGLAITKRIVQAHGGSLTITSNAAEGTIATVLLPIPAQD